MKKEVKQVARAIREDESNWHYVYASKTVESWPTWKKEIYSQNFSSSTIKREVESGRFMENKK